MKTILIPTERADTMVWRLELALLVAKQFASYVEGFALRVSLASLAGLEDGGAMFADSLARENLEAEKEARELFEGFMRDCGVPRADESRSALSFGWLENAPEGDRFVGSRGRVFDLTILGRPGVNPIGSEMAALEFALFDSGHPILIAPPSRFQHIGTNVLIAWNCSTEQARATAFAMPFLQQANSVTVLTVDGGTSVAGPTGEELCRYLKSHRVSAQSSTVGLEGRSTGEAILATATARGCDLLVKGAYTQSRLRQMIFGGATRHILAHATLPVLMAH